MPDNPFIGEIYLFGGNFAPQGFAFCQGQLLSISQNSALFSLLGTQYGGDGIVTFALPDLQGRVPIGAGAGAGLSARSIGERGGTESHTLAMNELPSHSHTLQVQTAEGNTSSPSDAIPATTSPSVTGYSSGAPNGTMAASTIGNSGASQPHNNLQPYLALNYIIALEGIYPSQF
jgi:microcystin-dependent protein